MPHDQAQVVLYTIYGCPWCKRAAQTVKRLGLNHKIINIGNNANLMMQLNEETGWPTVPKVFVNGKFIGGYNELEDLLHKQGLI